MERCQWRDCTTPATYGSPYCSLHDPHARRNHHDYLGGEENRRSPIIGEPDEKEPIEFKKCPLCNHMTVIRLCVFHWGGRPVKQDEPYTLEKRAHNCDLWVCFYCGLRLHYQSGRMNLPDTLDLKLEDYRREDWNA